VRALLDLLRENEAVVKTTLLLSCQILLHQASFDLKILNPEHGEEELIKSVAAERANLMR
jgi:hypothetical protein